MEPSWFHGSWVLGFGRQGLPRPRAPVLTNIFMDRGELSLDGVAADEGLSAGHGLVSHQHLESGSLASAVHAKQPEAFRVAHTYKLII